MKKKFLNKSATLATAIAAIVSATASANVPEKNVFTSYKQNLSSSSKPAQQTTIPNPFTLYKPVEANSNSVHAAHGSHASHESHASHASHSSHASGS